MASPARSSAAHVALTAASGVFIGGMGVATSSASTASWVNLIKPAVMKKAIIIIVATAMITLVIFKYLLTESADAYNNTLT